MRNLISFLTRYYAFFLFLGLELLCAYLIFNFNHFQRARFLSSSSVVSASFYNSKNTVTSYFNLNNVNEELARKNAELMQQLHNPRAIEYRYSNDSVLLEMDRIYLDSSQLQRPLYEFIDAKIIDKTTKRIHNYMIVNKGLNQGIQPQMGVVGTDGVVGIVQKVSNNYATIMTLLHKEIRLSAKVKKNNYYGSLRWNGKSPFVAQLKDIPINISVEVGDTIITSGLSDFFPPNISVGTVSAVNREPGNNFHDISVNLSTVFGSINSVYIINFKDRAEVENLQKEVRSE